ncbi:hypothetical protein GX50_06820 [[Emmonsia] crescens]|uniref:TM7S3/TM198-like domain-containing protein n=1 Tax=[Emmonsia] crescens TaxID=73230 RepID=A0A2B7ZA26_9EURO|nr:hypothetical protein GX50_06820 [Emmonsia crescens]
MRASFMCIVFCSLSIIGPACVGGIQVLPRQDVKVPEPTESSPTTTLQATDPSSKPSSTVAETKSASGTQSALKPDPTATTSSANDTSPRPSDLSFLNGIGPDPTLLPLPPKITPGLSFAGVVLIIAGGVYASVGVRNKWIQIFFSAGFLSAIAVTILIFYLMQPPVSDAVQGAFFVAAVVTGSIFGGISLAFREVSEGFGCMLGGFSLSMWILTMKPGGLLVETGHKAAFIACLTLGLYTLSFTRRTRPYGLICSTSFSGATSMILGIDCFSKAGLKEFWIYIWALNDKVFPFNTKSYPITRGIRAELAGTVVFFLMGLISQAKLWKVIRDRRRREAALREEEQKKRDQIEEEIAKNLEEGTNRERAHWETVYGDQQRPPNDSGIEIGPSEGHEIYSGTPDDRIPAKQGQVYEMDALRRPDGDDTNYTPHRSRESIQPFVAAAAAMPIQSNTPLSNTSSAGDVQDTNPNITPGHQTGLHEMPADTEMLVTPNIAMNSVKTNLFEARADDDCSSVAASLAESDYMAGMHADRVSVHSIQHPIHGRVVESNLRDHDGDGLTFVNDTRSISSSVEVEPNEELDYNPELASQTESGSRGNPSSVYSDFQESAKPTPITEPDSSILENANDNDNEVSVKNHAPAPMIRMRPADSNLSERTPCLADSINKCDENDGFSLSETECIPAVDAPFQESEKSSRKMPCQEAKLAVLEDPVSNRPPAVAGPVGGSISSDQQTSDKHDKPTDVLESPSSSIPVSKRLSKRQSALSPRAKLTSESVDNIPSHMSRVVLSHRTNEWAKHISDAEPPEVKEIDDPQQDTETDEPVAPVLVSELQQTATSTLSYQKLDTDNPALRRSQYGEGSGPVPSSPRKSYTGVQTTNNIPSPSPVKSSNSTNGSQTPPIYPLHRSASNSPLNLPGQPDTNRTRPSSSALSTYKPASGTPEMNETGERTPPARELRMFSAPLLVQRESAIRNRSLLLPSNYSSTAVDRFSRSQSQLSLNPPPQAAYRSPSPYPTLHHTSVESADDLPLSVRRSLIHRDMQPQNQAQTQPWQQRPASVCSFPSLDHKPPVTARRQYQDQPQTQDSLQIREAKLARWRESVREENVMKHLPEAVVETRRADLLKEHQRSRLGKQKKAIRASYRESVIDQAMRKGDMQYIHTEALRRMQAAANKHV